MQLGYWRYKAILRLRTVFFIVGLVILCLPLGSIVFFRIYENELVHQTELSLISQAAVLSAAYKAKVSNIIGSSPDYGKALSLPQKPLVDHYYNPIRPQLDLASHDVLPRRPDGIKPNQVPDAVATEAGIWMLPVLLESQKNTLAGMKILDFKGTVITGRKEVGLSFAHLPEVQAALQGKYSTVIRQRISDEAPPALVSISRGAGIRIFVALPIIQNEHLWGVVYLSRTPKNILKHLYAEKDKVAVAGATILGLALIITLFTSYTVTQPIYRLINNVEKVSTGQDQVMAPLAFPVTHEIALLADSFNKMATSLHERSAYIREFAAHVSHELKTPLTSIQGAVELIIDHMDEMDQQTRSQFLANILQDTNRLKQLVSRLLDLARADNVTITHEATLLQPVLDKLADRYQQEGIQVVVPTADTLGIKIVKENLETIFLIENARQHDATRVVINIKEQLNMITITVTDNGAGISPGNQDKIFTPFFTTRREHNGTGLGLSIVKSLIEAYGGTICIKPCSQGACFELAVKKASSAQNLHTLS
ncbi:ATP-binding protein [Zooshikella sp. RANM57]|uniref:sensor histidine kinase n=1 Tax=Zooshikella sp. RANM57 TaxID=3425863 RepID=UPI003D6EAFD4